VYRRHADMVRSRRECVPLTHSGSSPECRGSAKGGPFVVMGYPRPTTNQPNRKGKVPYHRLTQRALADTGVVFLLIPSV
jgi:hypothetical protein